ncbi:MFS transporter [Kitasatospora sp. NBC_01287]|uniref:MFS transporter n=1 Tax=Kitasatospora sp. NBC_01287 TaxID=2903573 RepID=UPI002251D78D|nr:MFS transporter [Kitasatospora sp. NBC_01287]MCX4748432.1 MFS transporter [Kitasatospora sp. NBC_01287]
MSTTPDRPKVPLWLSIVACSVPMFMVALDNLVVSTALRTLAVKLHAGTTDLQWFVNAYVLSFSCLLLIGAALGDRFGRRKVFAIGIAIFTLASVSCGMASTSGELITARAVQGFGAAAVMPLSLTLLSQAVPERLRSLALGLWGAVSGLAIAFGPVVGGAVVDGLAWQWIFWINVPVGIVAIPLVLRVLRESKGERVKLDLAGMLLAAAGLLAVVWGIVNGSTDGWTAGRIVGAFAAGAVLLTAFVLWERRAPHPLLPLGFYRVRAFTLTNIVSAAMYFGVFGSIFFFAQYLQIAPPRTPLQAGVLTLAWTLMPMFIAPVAGALTDKVGGGRLMALGLFLQAAGLTWINLVATTDTPYSHMVGGMILGGAGMGFAIAPTAAVVLGAVGPEHRGKASGANTTVREIGGALGIAVLSSVFLAHGSTADAQDFVRGLHPAVWVGVVVVVLGGVCALFIPRPPRPAAVPSGAGATEEAGDREVPAAV